MPSYEPGQQSEECPLCEGSGECVHCDGTGWIDGTWRDEVDVPCEHCQGTGNCPTCDGTGVVPAVEDNTDA